VKNLSTLRRQLRERKLWLLNQRAALRRSRREKEIGAEIIMAVAPSRGWRYIKAVDLTTMFHAAGLTAQIMDNVHAQLGPWPKHPGPYPAYTQDPKGASYWGIPSKARVALMIESARQRKWAVIQR